MKRVEWSAADKVRIDRNQDYHGRFTKQYVSSYMCHYSII